MVAAINDCRYLEVRTVCLHHHNLPERQRMKQKQFSEPNPVPGTKLQQAGTQPELGRAGKARLPAFSAPRQAPGWIDRGVGSGSVVAAEFSYITGRLRPQTPNNTALEGLGLLNSLSDPGHEEAFSALQAGPCIFTPVLLSVKIISNIHYTY